jgi:hypothetical protein
MKGRDLQKTIMDYATMCGWRCLHFESVRVQYPGGKMVWKTPFSGSGKGFPDVFAIRRDRIVAIEVKGKGDTLKAEQEQWLAELNAVPCVDAVVATPKDWLADDSVVRNLLR